MSILRWRAFFRSFFLFLHVACYEGLLVVRSLALMELNYWLLCEWVSPPPNSQQLLWMGFGNITCATGEGWLILTISSIILYFRVKQGCYCYYSHHSPSSKFSFILGHAWLQVLANEDVKVRSERWNIDFLASLGGPTKLTKHALMSYSIHLFQP